MKEINIHVKNGEMSITGDIQIVEADDPTTKEIMAYNAQDGVKPPWVREVDYIMVPRTEHSNWDANAPVTTLPYKFDLGNTGDVKIDIEVLASGYNQDSFFFNLDNGAWREFNHIGQHGQWQIVTVFDGQLKKGEHRLFIKHRETGTRIRKIIIREVLNAG